MRKIRKQIDIPEDDFVALQVLASRQGTNLKNCIERFLHMLATTAINQELEQRIKKMEQENNEDHGKEKESNNSN